MGLRSYATKSLDYWTMSSTSYLQAQVVYCDLLKKINTKQCQWVKTQQLEVFTQHGLESHADLEWYQGCEHTCPKERGGDIDQHELLDSSHGGWKGPPPEVSPRYLSCLSFIHMGVHGDYSTLTTAFIVGGWPARGLLGCWLPISTQLQRSRVVSTRSLAAWKRALPMLLGALFVGQNVLGNETVH